MPQELPEAAAASKLYKTIGVVANTLVRSIFFIKSNIAAKDASDTAAIMKFSRTVFSPLETDRSDAIVEHANGRRGVCEYGIVLSRGERMYMSRSESRSTVAGLCVREEVDGGNEEERKDSTRYLRPGAVR